MPPLLLVHGAWHAAWAWEEHWAPAARERGWEVTSHDLPGHGARRGPGDPDPSLTLSDLAADVRRAASSFPEPPVVVGHSLGGLLVQMAANEVAAAGVVLVASVPPWGSSGVATSLLLRHPLDTLSLGLGDPPDHRRYLFGDRLDDEEADRHLRRLQRETIVAQLRSSLPRRPRRLHVPVLVLGGGEDRLVSPVAHVRTARWHRTRAHLYVGMGHDLMLDAGWRAPLERMLEWLEQLPPGGRAARAPWPW